MYKYYSSYFLLVGGFTHFLCCGIPFILGLSSLLTNINLIEYRIINNQFLETLEIILFALTSVIFLSLIALKIYETKKKSTEEIECCEILYDTSKKKKI